MSPSPMTCKGTLEVLSQLKKEASYSLAIQAITLASGLSEAVVSESVTRIMNKSRKKSNE